MNKAAFLSELKNRLRRLPQEEIENAISYYDEYINEAGTQNEQKVIMDLGSPSAVASKIIGEFAVTDAEVKKKKSTGLSSMLIVILAIFASPIALPFAAAILICILSIFLVYFSFFIAGFGFFISGIAYIAVGIWAMLSSFSTGLFCSGIGLILISAGAAIVLASSKLSKITFCGLQKSLGNLLIRRGVK